MAHKIFISYRRDDSGPTAGRLYDRLAEKFGEANIFIDVDNMPAGVDFVKHLNKQVECCDLFLCAVGPNWLSAKDEDGHRRLDQPDDYVRVEIAAALNRDIPVIPVLIDGARVPKARELPNDIAALNRRHAVEVRNSHFRRDADGLTEQIREVLKLKRTTFGRRFITPAVAVIALVMLGLIGAYEKGMVSLPWPHSNTNAQKAPLEAVTALPANPAANQNSTMVVPTKPAAPSARPSPDIPTDCDWLAANNSDPQRPKVVPGVVYIEQINVAPALAACKEAVSNNPDVARFSYQLGRVLDASKDYSAARIQYDRAADLGSTAAMNNIGLLYSLGKGVPLDYAVAKRWFDKAAAAGNSDAIVNIGDFYKNGRAVPQDYAEAKRWYDKAVAAGSSTAMNNIGYLYSSGYGVPQDYAEAKRWFDKAAAAGNSGAMNNIGYLYDSGQGVPQDYAEAKRWYEKAAAAGSTDAMNNIGYLYDSGRGVPQDYAEAKRWYEKAAAADNADAMLSLGDLYRDGHGVTKSVADARVWYQKAAAAGSKDAQGRLASLPGQ